MTTPINSYQTGNARTPPSTADGIDLPRTRTGSIKQKLSWAEKLRILDPSSPVEDTEARLREFMSLFAFRVGDASITQVNGGPRAWTALRGRIYLEHVVRHLLGARIPTVPPQWIAARSFSTTQYFAIDVDADRTPEQKLAEQYDLSRFDDEERRLILKQVKPAKAKPPFAARCGYIEEALRGVGIDPDDPHQVLIQQTPSGGRHYFFFLDAPYDLSMPQEVFKQLGLRHTPGQFELFPSTSQALRLPFGHVPGQPHDPKAWIRFIDNYRFRRIKRFSVMQMYEALETPQQGCRSTPEPTKPSSARPRTIHATVQGTRPPGGVPKRERQAIERFQVLVHQGPKSPQEAQELMDLGIRLPGQRTETLKHLAAHLIWFKGLSADEATEQLVTWASDWRHISQDIRADLEHGTRHVAKQIECMCAWYAKEKKPRIVTDRPLFADSELASLWPHIQPLPAEERAKQAHFLLSFLRFAKLHGQPASDSSGWEAAPAINAVVKQWEGCQHANNYRKRIDHAKAAGIFIQTKEKWQNPRGKGRARTYKLAVPVVKPGDCDLGYDDALARLTQEVSIPAVTASEEMVVPMTDDEAVERSDRHERPSEQDTERQGAAGSGNHPAAVPQAGSGVRVDQGTSKRSQQPATPVNVPGEADGGIRAVPAAAPQPLQVNPTSMIFADELTTQRQGEVSRAAVRVLLADVRLPRQLRRILLADPDTLSDTELKARTILIHSEQNRPARRPLQVQAGSHPGYILPKRERIARETAARSPRPVLTARSGN